LLDKFKNECSVTFRTVATKPTEKDEVAVFRASAFYGIRIERAIPLVFGAKTTATDHAILLKVRHAAMSTLRDENGEPWHFSHMLPVVGSATLKTTIEPDSVKIGDLGSGGVLVDKYLDSMGLYSYWKVWVPKETSINPGLDLSGVTELRLYFTGTRRTTAKLQKTGGLE
jgi:hypothetical protein